MDRINRINRIEGSQERGGLWRQSLEEEKQGESKFDGVLVFLASNLALTLLLAVYNMSIYIQLLGQPAIYRSLLEPTPPEYQRWANISVGEILGSIYVLALGTFLLWLFVRRKRLFRGAMIWSIAVGLAFPVLIALIEDRCTFGLVTQQLIPVIALGAYWAAGWLPYFLISKRVKSVFVR